MLDRRAAFWLLLALVLGLILWRLSDILLPFIAGAAIAYFLDPLVDWMERRRVPRTLATLLALTLVIVFIGLLLLLVVPLIESQVAQLIARLPDLFTTLRDRLDRLITRLQVEAGVPPEDVRSFTGAAGSQASKAFEWVASLLGGVVSGGIALVNLLSLLFVTPVVAFYLLRDWDQMVASVDSWLPRANAEAIRGQMREIDHTLSNFARGQALACLLLGLYYATGLSLVGLDFGLVIGVFSGLISFIPYVGSFTGGVLSIGFALMQYDHWTGVIEVAAVFLVGQAIEGNVLQPLLVGDRIGLHPVWVIFALLAGGALFGFVGLLLAIPVASILGVLTRFALARYLASPLYQDGSAVAARTPERTPS